jgi:hypothetical protein
MIKETIVIDAETGKAESNVDKLSKSIDKLTDSVDDLGKESKDSLDNIEKSSKNTEKGVKRIGKAFKGLGTAIKAAGIGLVIGALATLKEVFESNQKVADAFSIAFETVSIVFNELVGSIVDVYESVTKSTNGFQHLKKVIGGLIDIALAPLKATFFAVKLGLQEAQLAWEKSFFGDKDPTKIKELNESIKETKESLSGVGTSVKSAVTDIAENAIGAAKEIGTVTSEVIDKVSKVSISAAIESAKTNVQLTKSSEKAQAEQTKLIETYDRQAEKQRQIRDNDLLTIEERKKANEKLGEVLDKQEEAMIKQADAILAAAQAQFEKNGNDENQIALIEAQTNRLGVLAQIEGFRSEQKSNEVALQKESLELTNSQTQAEGERTIAELEANAELIENEYYKLQALKDVAEQEKQIQTDLLTAKRDSYKKGTQAYQDANNELLAFQEENAQKQKQIDRDLTDAKMAETSKALGTIASIVGENSKFGKGIAVVQAIQDTYAGATKALAQGGIFGYIGAAGIIASGLANVKKITSTKEPKAPSFAKIGGSAPSISVPAPTIQAPSFNIVGSSETNQLAEAIGSQTQQPIKAYVVSNDITTAQELDRNIVEGASL